MMDPILTRLIKAYLSDDKRYLSGQELGKALGVSRAAIWKKIENYRRWGLDIESIPNKGYLVKSLPSKRILPELVYFRCELCKNLEVFYIDEIHSTNTKVKEIAISGKHHDFVLVTDNQTAGRGRSDRKWISEPGQDLMFSLALNLNESLSHFFHYTVLSVLAIRNVLAEYDQRMKIKWPNDILFEGRKVCGVLSEMLTEGYRLTDMIIGVGINVNRERMKESGKSAISLKQIAGKELNRNILLSDLLNKIIRYLSDYQEKGFSPLFREWREHLAYLGEEISFHNGKQEVRGIFQAVHEDGSIELLVGDETKRYYTGDVLDAHSTT